MVHGSCDLHLHVIMKVGEGFPFFFQFYFVCTGPQTQTAATVPLPCPGSCWWQVTRCGGTTVWARPAHFVCSSVVICIGYSVLNGLRSYSAALFSAAYKIRPKYRNQLMLPQQLLPESHSASEPLLRALPVEMILMSGAWPKPEVISCSVKEFPLGVD